MTLGATMMLTLRVAVLISCVRTMISARVASRSPARLVVIIRRRRGRLQVFGKDSLDDQAADGGGQGQQD
jgi:hypothetical protein